MYVSLCEDDADDVAFCLPRNLSYAEESYLDNYCVSSSFVYSTDVEKRRFFEIEKYLLDCAVMSENDIAISSSDADSSNLKTCGDTVVGDDVGENEGVNADKADSTTINGAEFYLNSSDDLDSVGSSTGKSNYSDLEFMDAINSPDEFDLGKENGGDEATLGEAVSKALEIMHFQDDENVEDKNSETQPTTSFASKRLSSPPPLHIKVDSVNDDDDDDSRKRDESRGSQKSLLDSPLYEDTEFNFNKTELRKSSSLKASKTPPGTPSRKKMVRFADAMGLDLESVRHVLNTDAPPKIPASAIADLKVGIEKDRKGIGSLYLCSKFQQPGAQENFLVEVMAKKVSLENAVITDLTITGTVRVANIGFHKVVRVRYTTNAWHSFHDIMASYVINSCDGPTDRFSFSVVAPSDFGVGSRLEFAISYTVGDAVYWDNNNGENYCFECFAKTTPVETRDSWIHFL